MRGIRGHLTYANVVATLALIIAVGGGAAYAANTVFSEDIVNNEVKSVDIAPGAVDTSDIADDAVNSHKILPGSVQTSDIGTGQVRSSDVLDNDLTGADVNEPTLSGVNAGTVSGLQVRKINFQVPIGTGPTPVLDLAGLQITAECQNFGDLVDVKAFTSKNGASAHYFAGSTFQTDDTDEIRSIDADQRAPTNGFYFDVGDSLEIDNATPNSGQASIGTLHYSAPDGSVVVAHLALDEVRNVDTHLLEGCTLTGIAMGG